MIIDTHTHLFASDEEKYLLALSPMYRSNTDGSVELLREQMDAACVDRAVTISPWPYEWDPSYALDVLEVHREWLTVGVLLDPYDPEGPATLERFVRNHCVSGLRIQGKILDPESP